MVYSSCAACKASASNAKTATTTFFTGGHQQQSLSRCGIGSDSVFAWLSTNQTWFIQVAQPAKPQERVNWVNWMIEIPSCTRNRRNRNCEFECETWRFCCSKWLKYRSKSETAIMKKRRIRSRAKSPLQVNPNRKRRDGTGRCPKTFVISPGTVRHWRSLVAGGRLWGNLDFDVWQKHILRQQVAMQAESDGHQRLKTITMRQVQQREDWNFGY